MPKSLIEQLPEIVKRGRDRAEKILESLEGRHRVGLQTREWVLPAKDSKAADWISQNARQSALASVQSGLFGDLQPSLGDALPAAPWRNRLIYGDNLLAIAAEGGIFGYLRERLPGFDVQVVDYGAGAVSLYAVRGTPKYLFNVHLDTVPDSPHWSADPHVMRRLDDRVVGLGVCDIKGAAAALVLLLGLAWVILRGSRKLPLAAFFSANAVLLCVLSVVFAGHGVAALQEAGVLGTRPVAFFEFDWLGIHADAWSLSAQALALAGIATLYGRSWLGERRRAAAANMAASSD